jgi:DNA-binding XRE family transcriptional regulator
MKAPIDHQIIKKDGVPLFVLVPYEDYIKVQHVSAEKVYLPHEVVETHILEHKSLPRAWREYKGFSQEEIANRMGISQESYSQMEKAKARLRKTTKQRIAVALGITVDQLET